MKSFLKEISKRKKFAVFLALYITAYGFFSLSPLLSLIFIIIAHSFILNTYKYSYKMIFVKLFPLLLATIGVFTLTIMLNNAGGWGALISLFFLLILIVLIITLIVFFVLYLNVVLRARAEGIDAPQSLPKEVSSNTQS